MRTRGQSGGRRPAWTSWTPTPEPASTRNRSSARETSVAGPRRAGLGGGEPVPRSTARMAIELRGGLRPASEASPWDALRTAGRRGAGAPPSEASSRKSAPAKLALERRSRRASFLQRGPQDRVGSISVQAPAPALLNLVGGHRGGAPGPGAVALIGADRHRQLGFLPLAHQGERSE